LPISGTTRSNPARSPHLSRYASRPPQARASPAKGRKGYHAGRGAPARQSRKVTNLGFLPATHCYIYFAGTLGARQSHGVSRRRDIATRTLFQEGYQKLSRVSFCGSPLLNSYFRG